MQKQHRSGLAHRPHYHQEGKEDLNWKWHLIFVSVIFLAGALILLGVWKLGKEFVDTVSTSDIKEAQKVLAEQRKRSP